MKTFIKTYDLENIKKKFIILYALNVSDIVLTLLLYSTGLFEEVNTLIAGMINSDLWLMAIKVILPGALLLFEYFRMQKATQDQLKKSNISINIILLFYTLVNLFHILWIILLPIFYLYI